MLQQSPWKIERKCPRSSGCSLSYRKVWRLWIEKYPGGGLSQQGLKGSCGFLWSPFLHSFHTVSFACSFINMDFRPSLILPAMSVFPSFFFFICLRNIKTKLNRIWKMTSPFFFGRVCLFFCTCCHLCYFDGLDRAGSASCALQIKLWQWFVPNDFNMKIVSAAC